MSRNFTFEKEMIRMLEYVLEKKIEIVQEDIEKIKLHMRLGMFLKNDPNKEMFFINMEIMAPKMSQTILRKGINYALQTFQGLISEPKI